MKTTEQQTDMPKTVISDEARAGWRDEPQWLNAQQRIVDALNTDQTIEKTDSSGKSKTVIVPALGDRQIISARELWLFCVGQGKPVNWIESYKALLKYVSKDYHAVFRPTIKGDNSGTRYYVKADDVADFLFMFENNKFSDKEWLAKIGM